MPEHVQNNPQFLIPFGLFVGAFAGFTGLGGGAVIVPVLVLLLGFDQKSAQGTSLAVIASPLQIPAMIRYHGEGALKLWTASYMLPGMLCGSYLGAWGATSLPVGWLKLIFGFALVYVAGYQIFGKAADAGLGRAVVMSTLLTASAGLLYGASKWWDATR
jgi:uncharacterized membrane protein YfcA